MSSWRTEERKLDQRRIERVLEPGDGNLEKFRANFGTEAHQNSKNKAFPQQRLHLKEALKFRGEARDFIGTVR